MSTCLALNCHVRSYPFRLTIVKFPRRACSQHAGLEADNLGCDQRGVEAILEFHNAKYLESRPCPMYAMIYHSATKDRIAGERMQGKPCF